MWLSSWVDSILFSAAVSPLLVVLSNSMQWLPNFFFHCGNSINGSFHLCELNFLICNVKLWTVCRDLLQTLSIVHLLCLLLHWQAVWSLISCSLHVNCQCWDCPILWDSDSAPHTTLTIIYRCLHCHLSCWHFKQFVLDKYLIFEPLWTHRSSWIFQCKWTFLHICFGFCL